MTKKALAIISFWGLIISYILINRLQVSNFTVFNNVSEEDTVTIKNTLCESERLSFTALLCNEIRIPFDDEGKTFYVSLDMEETLWETLKFESGQAEYQVMFQEDITKYDKQKLISQGKKIPIIIYDDSQWATYYVVFSGLPLIDLATEEGFWLEEIQGNAVFYDVDFSKNGTKESAYNGHIRGNTSRMFPKKGYKLNLTMDGADGTAVNNKQALFGMREDDDWILYAMYNDDTKIRDALSMQVWEEIGAYQGGEKSYYGPKITYVELFADNCYHGLYALMEPVDAKQLNLQEEDYLYKRKSSGGFNYDSFVAETNPYIELNGFEIKAGIMDEFAWQPIAELARLTYGSEEEFDYRIRNTMNLDSGMRMWLFAQIITGHDHTAKNVFYIAKNEEEGYKFYFAPWDMDLTWGNVSVGEVNPHYTEYEPLTVDDRVYWDAMDRAIDLNTHGITEKMQKLYKELRSTTLTNERIVDMIYQLDSRLRRAGAYTRDVERWPDAAHVDTCFELERYAVSRLEFLDKALYNFECFAD